MTQVGIFGATGYTGHELIQILSRHREVEIVALGSQSQPGVEVTLPIAQRKSAHQCKSLIMKPLNEAMNIQIDVAFFCLPHGTGATLAAQALERGIRVIDLSADFRLRCQSTFETTYGQAHPVPEVCEQFVYGLPELFREKIKSTRACANPGCYPTTVALALAPLLREFNLPTDSPIIVDAKSGVSGAGRRPTDATHFISVHENFRPYNVGRTHRHVPEMEQTLRDINSEFANKIIFTPGVLPISRGMVSSVYVPLPRSHSQTELSSLFNRYYMSEPFVTLLTDGQSTPEVAAVRGGHGAVISVHALDDTALIIVAIDNLGKGASGQAVQNFNLMMGFEETHGLIQTDTTH